MWKKLINSHPMLFALFPVIALYGINFSKFTFAQVIPSLVILEIIALMLLLAGWLISRNVDMAAFLSSLTVFLFMNYGHVYVGLYDFIEDNIVSLGIDTQIHDLSLGVHFLLLPIWFLLFFVGYVIFNRWSKWKRHITQYLFLLSIISLLFPFLRIFKNWSAMEIDFSEVISSAVENTYDIQQFSGEKRPDIYYIILDAYGRQDTLQEFYNYDNSQFVDQLAEFGFYTARYSRSNYSNTNRSLASSLNMTYLEGGMEIPSDDVMCEKFLAQSISSSKVIQILRELGYKIVSFSTGFRTTEIQDADLYLSPENPGLNAFEILLIQRSMLLPFFDITSSLNGPFEHIGYSAHRERISFTLDQLPKLSNQPEPIFVFAHIVAPHPPFVFDSVGEAKDQKFPFALGDGNVFPRTREEYVEGYTEQLTYMNKAILKVIQQLVQESTHQPVILIQGDHGPRSVMEWGSPSQDAMRESMAILNMYYLPGLDVPSLYDEISPVNSFRMVFNTYFNAGFELLSDRSCFTSRGCQDFCIPLPEEREVRQD